MNNQFFTAWSNLAQKTALDSDSDLIHWPKVSVKL